MPQPAMLLGAMPHHNSGLFSDHYLNVTLPRREDWQALAAAARPVLDAVRRIYAAYTPSDNEAQIEKDLLEYQLRSDDCEDGWTVALLNDKGERHATGSYYTPDYIVKYMVDATLGPVLRAAVEGARDDATKVAQVLAVNVLDPAMGSGHFLVEATAYIARFLVELGVRESEGGDEADAFVEEVRKRRPKAAGALTPATLKALKSGYAEQAMPLRRRYAEAAALERALSDLVNAAYGLTPAEIDLLWATAPPRMPIGRPAGAPPSP